MLSDRDREVLYEIGHQLTLEDPAFGRSFEVGAHRLAGQPWYRRRSAYTITMAVFATLTMFTLMVGSATTALVLAVVAALIWEARRRSGNAIPST